MNSSAGRLEFGIGLNTSELKRNASEAKNAFHGIGDEAVMEGVRIDNAFNSVKRTVISLVGGFGLAALTKQMFNVRASFQDAETVLRVFLGTAEEAKGFLDELKEYAHTSNPFDLSDLLESSNQLMAYGTQAEDVIETLHKLSEVASGTSGSLASLVDVYNRAKSFDRLDTQMLRSLASKGVVVTETLREMGVEVDSAALKFEHLEMAIEHMTGESGKFHGMMEAKMQNLSTIIGDLQDDFDFMLDDIGRKTEKIMGGTIQSLSWVLIHYEQIGKVLLQVAAVYGTYRAAIIANTLAQSMAIKVTDGYTAAEMRRYRALLLIEKAQKKLNLTMLKNPMFLITAALVSLATAFVLYRDKTTAAEKATKEFNAELDELNRKQEEERNKTTSLINIIRDKTRADGERMQALKELVKAYPSIFEKYDIEILTLEEILQLQKDINEEEAKRYTSSLQSKYEEQQQAVEAAQKAYDQEMKEQAWDEKRTSQLPRLKAILDKEKAKLVRYEMEIQKDAANKMMADLTGFSNEDLEKEIDARERLLRSVIKKQEEFDNQGVKKEAVGTLKGWGTFSRQELEAQTNIFTKELNRRQATKVTGLQLLEHYNKELEQLLKEETEIYNSQMEEGQKKRALEEVRAKIKDINSWIDFYTLKKETAGKGEKSFQAQMVDNSKYEQRLLEDLQYQVQESEIATMEEGIEKELALLALNHQKKLTQITRQEEDLLEQFRDFKEHEWDALGKKGKFDRSSITLTEDEKGWFDSLRDNEVVSYEQSVDAVHEALLQKYRNYVEQKHDIEAKYRKDIDALTKQHGADSSPVLEAVKQMEEELQSLKEDILQDAGDGILNLFLYGDASELITDKIKSVLPLFEDITKLTFKELQRAKQAVSELKFTPEQLQLFEQAGIDVEKLKKALEDAKDAADEMLDEQKWEKIATMADKLAGSLSQLGSSLSQSGGALGEIGNVISSLSGSISDITTAIKSTKPEEVISAGISGLSTIFSTIFSQVEKNKQAQEEWNDKLRAAAHAAALTRIELEAYQSSNIFGVENPYQKAIAGANKYAAAMHELHSMSNTLGDGQVQIGTKKVADAGNIASGVGGGAAVGAAIGTAVGGWALGLGTVIGAAIGAVVGGITTAFSAPKVVAVFDSLASQYGEIFDPDTFELNPEILNDYQKFDDATRDLIDNWEEIRSKALEAQEEMRDTFRQLAGDIGKQLSDSLVNAFKDGDLFSALDDFQNKVTEVIENIIAQMIFAQYFQDLFDDLEEDMEKSFDIDGDQDIVDDVMRFFDKLEGRVGGYGDAMSAIEKELSEKGWELFSGGDRSAQAKGFQAMSQDSADELNGRFAAIQGHTYQITESMKMLFANSTQSLLHLAAIESNTTKLETIADIMKYVKSGIDSINSKGVLLR